MGYKAGPLPPEARLAEQATVEVEPAKPDSKPLPHPCHIQPLTKEKTKRDDEDGRECKAVESHSEIGEERKEERQAESKQCLRSEPERTISVLPPCPSPSSDPDPACPVTGKGLQAKLSVVCPGQDVRPEEPELSKEKEDDEECGKEDTEEDGEEKMSEPTECTVSVPGEEEKEEEEESEENVEVVEDGEEQVEESGRSPDEDLVELTRSPIPCPASDPVLPVTACTAAQLQGAYMWSLELLIAAALCATRDALYPPVPAVPAPNPPPHHGMEILGEVADLEIQQRNRESREKDSEGDSYKTHLFFFSTI